MKVRIVVGGRNYDLADSIPQQLTLPEGASVDDALTALLGHVPKNRSLSGSCLIAVSGVHLGSLQRHHAQLLQDGDELLVLSPVAGG
jgi:molybdopterin converting factor small subunit